MVAEVVEKKRAGLKDDAMRLVVDGAGALEGPPRGLDGSVGRCWVRFRPMLIGAAAGTVVKEEQNVRVTARCDVLANIKSLSSGSSRTGKEGQRRYVRYLRSDGASKTFAALRQHCKPSQSALSAGRDSYDNESQHQDWSDKEARSLDLPRPAAPLLKLQCNRQL